MLIFSSFEDLKHQLLAESISWSNWPNWTLHRGLHLNFPENSAAAFHAGISQGFTSFETDFRTTADGFIVLCHDAQLNRLVSINKRVEDLKRADLEKLSFPNSQEKFLFLEEWYSRFNSYQWILDIKPETAFQVINTLRTWAKENDWGDFLAHKVRFLLWQKQHEDYLLKCFPNGVCLARESACWFAGLSALLHCGNPYSIKSGIQYALPANLLGKSLYTKHVISQYKKFDAKVIAYLPQHFEDIKKALSCGVDEILVNSLQFSTR